MQLPDVAAIARRTMIVALALGVVGLAALLFFNEPWAALGLCIGLGVGMTNFRLIIRSVVRVGRREQANKRRPLAVNTLGRLMAITVVALVLAWFETPLGLGIIGGVALFQFILLGNVTRSMLKAAQLAGAGLSGAVDLSAEGHGEVPAAVPGELPVEVPGDLHGDVHGDGRGAA